MEAPRVVFLVGAPRSGTTWLQLLLSSSPAVATADETHLFSVYLSGLFLEWRRFQTSGRGMGLHPLFDEHEFLERVRSFSDAVLRKILANKPGAAVILEKTPNHALYWKDIFAVYPDAYFLHLVRDPRAVVASLRAAGRGWGKSWANPGVLENARLWSESVGKAVEISRCTNRYLQVSYEELMDSPAERLSALFSWMGVETSLEDCKKIVDLNTPDKLKKAVQLKSGEIGRKPQGFFGGRGVEGWRKELSGSEIRAIERATAPLAETLGYFAAEKGYLPDWRICCVSLVLRFDRWWNWQKNRLLTRL